MNFSFGSNPATPTNKTTATGVFTIPTASPIQAQANPGSLMANPPPGGFGLGAGDTKSTGLTFGTPGLTPTASPAPSTTSTPAGQPKALSGFSLQTTPATSAPPTIGSGLTSISATTFQASPSVFSPPVSSTTLKTGTPTTSVTSTLPTTVPATSLVTSTVVTAAPTGLTVGLTAVNMNYIQLEETINKWTLELEEQEKLFINQATQINAWDRQLVNNSEKIVELNRSVEDVKLQQQQLDHELDFILAQQRELDECLVPLEKELASTPANIDPQREYTYHMAESMDTQLKQMSEDLKEIIDHLNEPSRTQDVTDPIIQIGRILNAHMNTLQWIDDHVLEIQGRLNEVSKLHDIHRRENERSFRLTYE